MPSDKGPPEIILPSDRERQRQARSSSTVVISRNGRTTVLTGWRARLAMAGGSLLLAAVVVLGGVLLLGIALTIATYLLLVVPLALAVAAAWMVLSGRR